MIASYQAPPWRALFRVGLPLAGVLDALSDVGDAAFDTGADVGEAITEGLAEAARDARDGLAEAARCSTEDATDRVGQAADCVAEGRGDDLGGTGGARVVVFVAHGGCCGAVECLE